MKTKLEKNLQKLLKKDKALFLAYDQGLEHGPESDFNDKNVKPEYILKIAKKGKYQGIIFQKGIAEKYSKEIKKSGVPLIIKLNGKTKLYKGDPLPAMICTVQEAIDLRASAVGFTIYIGSKHENEIIEQFEHVQKQAHAQGMPVIAWVYPRGKSVKNPDSRENLVYAARTGLELGADIVKLHWNGKLTDLKRAVKAAGRTRVVVAGGSKLTDEQLITNAKNVKEAGAAGMAIGRNVWQHAKPEKITKKLRKAIF